MGGGGRHTDQMATCAFTSSSRFRASLAGLVVLERSAEPANGSSVERRGSHQ